MLVEARRILVDRVNNDQAAARYPHSRERDEQRIREKLSSKPATVKRTIQSKSRKEDCWEDLGGPTMYGTSNEGGRMAWLEAVTTAVSSASGIDEAELTLAPAVRKEVLELARIASHSSGDRINAPLLCYALGIAVGRGTSLSDLGRAVREASGESSNA